MQTKRRYTTVTANITLRPNATNQGPGLPDRCQTGSPVSVENMIHLTPHIPTGQEASGSNCHPDISSELAAALERLGLHRLMRTTWPPYLLEPLVPDVWRPVYTYYESLEDVVTNGLESQVVREASHLRSAVDFTCFQVTLVSMIVECPHSTRADVVLPEPFVTWLKVSEARMRWTK